jgi:hypothetical protein
MDDRERHDHLIRRSDQSLEESRRRRADALNKLAAANEKYVNYVKGPKRQPHT